MSNVCDESEVTVVLRRISDGDGRAVHELMPLVYEELRRQAGRQMSGEGREHTLQATALVHEVYMKLLGQGAMQFESRRHFFNAAAEAMRCLLVDHARRRNAQKRGGNLARVDGERMADVACDLTADPTDWESLDLALGELKEIDERRYRVVMLRFFAGLTDAQVAQTLDLAEKTVERDWRAARIFLLGRVRELEGLSH